jgi:uncharacterized membrane protein
MIETLRSLLADPAFPNVHAVIVHFPVALLPAALLFDLGSLVFRRRIWMERAASGLYFVGTLAAAVAYLSGEKASEAMWVFSEAAQSAIADHEDLALLTLVAFAVITLLRIAASWLARHDRIVPIGFIRLVAVFAAVVGVLMLAVTAHHGGKLVYGYGMGVEGAPFAESAGDPSNDELEP